MVSTALTQPRQRALLYPQVVKMAGEAFESWFALHCVKKMCRKSSKKVEKVAEEIGIPWFWQNVWKSFKKVEKVAE